MARRALLSFVASGALAGLAGVLHAARYATISSNAGAGLELNAVAAAVIGGVAVTGGSGTVVGAALGAVLLATVNRALPTLGIADSWQQAVVGALVIGAIVLDRLLLLPARPLRRGPGRRLGPAPPTRPAPHPRPLTSRPPPRDPQNLRRD